MCNGLATGSEQHSCDGLVSDETKLFGNAARHCGFNSTQPLSSLSASAMRKLQRGKPKRKDETKAVNAEIGTIPRSEPIAAMRGGNGVEKQTSSPQERGFDSDSTCLEGSVQMDTTRPKCAKELPTNERKDIQSMVPPTGTVLGEEQVMSQQHDAETANRRLQQADSSEDCRGHCRRASVSEEDGGENRGADAP